MAQTMLRPRRRKVRRKGPVVLVAGMTVDELAAKVGLERRAVRFYIAQRLLPAPMFRGASTRYEREHLVRLLMVKKLKEEKLSLREIRGRIAVMPYAEIERAVLPLLAAVSEQATSAQAPKVAAAAVASATAGSTSAAESWERIAILPGLELHVRSNVSAHVRRVVKEIGAQFAAAVVEQQGGVSALAT